MTKRKKKTAPKNFTGVIYRTALNISFLKRNIEKGQHVSLHVDLFSDNKYKGIQPLH